jgi:protein O-mannosyl-transferase
VTLSFLDSRRALAGLAALAAALVYANALANGFALDDVYIIELNTRAHDPFDLRSIWLTPYWPFLGQELGLYRPGAIFFYSLQWSAGGGAAWVFHAVSSALHAGVTVLVFLLLERLTHRVPAFVGALVFAVHPVHVEAVANIVGQAEVIAAAAVLAACLVHSGRPPGVRVSWARRGALIALYMLALTTKESAVVMPALLVITDFAQRRVRTSVRGFADYAEAMLMPLFLLAATLAFYLIVRFGVMSGSIIGMDAAPAMPYLRGEYRILNALRAFPEFFRLFFFPQELAADYLPAVLLPVDTVRPMVVLGAVLLVVITAVALMTPWVPAAGFPAAWFLISIVTVSNLFFPIGVLVAERTLYLPSVALSALIAFAWQSVTTQPMRVRRLAVAGLSVVLVALGMRTWIRNPDWGSTNAVLSALVRDHPYSYRAQWARAAAFRSLGNHQLAEQHYRMSERIYPGDAQFLAEYGDFLLMRGRAPEAIDLLERSHDLQPRLTETVLRLSQAYLVAGRHQDVLDMTRRAEDLGVELTSTMAMRAAAYSGTGNHDNAIAAWRVAIRHAEQPNWQMWIFLARELAYRGLQREAVAALDSARSITSDAASLDVISRTEDAIATGCYDELRSDHGEAAGPPSAARACDPLRHWVGVLPRSQAAPRRSSRQ